MVLGIQIPQDILDIDNFESKAKYILIIEKNASFQKIINEGLLKKNKYTFVMITVSYISTIIIKYTFYLFLIQLFKLITTYIEIFF